MVLIDCFSSDVYVCHRESRIFQGPHFVKRLVYLPAMKPSFSLCFSVGNHFRVRVEHANYNWCQTMMMKRLILFSMVFIFFAQHIRHGQNIGYRLYCHESERGWPSTRLWS